MSLKRRCLLLVIAMVILGPSVVQSQWAGPIERLEVALWPEYDRQAVLVIYRFRLKPGSLLPATVALPVPVSVGQPHAVAWQNESGALMMAEFTRLVEDERAMIRVNMPSLEGQLEYYADLTVEGRRRTFLFSWLGGVDLDAFSYKVQRPAGVHDLEIVPPPNRQAVGGDGFTYEWIDHGPLKNIDKPTVKLSYEKDTAALSVEALEPSQPSDPVNPAPREPAEGGILPPWLLSIFGGVIVGIAASWYWWSSRKPSEKSPGSRGRQGARTKPAEKRADKARPNFCHNCGKKSESGANFCMSCGTRLHRR